MFRFKPQFASEKAIQVVKQQLVPTQSGFTPFDWSRFRKECVDQKWIVPVDSSLYSEFLLSFIRMLCCWETIMIPTSFTHVLNYTKQILSRNCLTVTEEISTGYTLSKSFIPSFSLPSAAISTIDRKVFGLRLQWKDYLWCWIPTVSAEVQLIWWLFRYVVLWRGPRNDS